MRDDHEALLGELRLLADSVFDRMEALVHQLAPDAHQQTADEPDDNPVGDERTVPGRESPTAAGSGSSWCPLCAGAALLRGENHELLSRLATGLAALIALLRELVARYLPAPREAEPRPDPPTDPTDRGGGFVPISVTIRT